MTATNQQQTLVEAEVFFDLVLGDDDLLRAEFDALIAACWESPSEPPRRDPSPPGGGWARRPPHRWPPWDRSLLTERVPAQRPYSRERGPPT
ncbi:hypothetical protein ACFTSF_40970 [Kribbella sp. NPDC056951]|uniref:hypothetical protein n=1 Tax=Kribbella sp. NPDC056951 TaxID=3345978 RepID=UPI00362FEDA4